MKQCTSYRLAHGIKWFCHREHGHKGLCWANIPFYRTRETWQWRKHQKGIVNAIITKGAHE